jgi:hypothetical protein
VSARCFVAGSITAEVSNGWKADLESQSFKHVCKCLADGLYRIRIVWVRPGVVLIEMAPLIHPLATSAASARLRRLMKSRRV